MRLIDVRYETPAENLACDEALLAMCENGFQEEILRFWTTEKYFVVLGYSAKAKSEVNLEGCQELKIPVLRRISGGGTVLQGPGCLNYSLFLKISGSNNYRNITQTNQTVMEAHRATIESILNTRIRQRGITDLTVNDLKFSGNAQRRKKNFLLFHGTFLLNMDLAMIEKCLFLPQKQPSYRKKRRHLDFLINLPIAEVTIKQALQEKWDACNKLETIPHAFIQELARQKYLQDDWNFRY
ncbi:MAG: lipoate--protein ligase family protein [Candidatus Omnitrophica bacterium]|nr:lipoate--protein ligase family protein [Candidatus Omnitrophota bacterium]